jgi:hypothetical protein
VKVGPDRLGALHEQLNGLVPCQLRDGRPLPSRLGQSEGWDGVQLLAAYVQRLTAGHQQLESWAAREELDRGRRGRHDLLEVVQYEQHALMVKLPLELGQQWPISRLGQADRPGDAGQHGLRVADGGEVDEKQWPTAMIRAPRITAGPK